MSRARVVATTLWLLAGGSGCAPPPPLPEPVQVQPRRAPPRDERPTTPRPGRVDPPPSAPPAVVMRSVPAEEPLEESGWTEGGLEVEGTE